MESGTGSFFFSILSAPISLELSLLLHPCRSSVPYHVAEPFSSFLSAPPSVRRQLSHTEGSNAPYVCPFPFPFPFPRPFHRATGWLQFATFSGARLSAYLSTGPAYVLPRYVCLFVPPPLRYSSPSSRVPFATYLSGRLSKGLPFRRYNEITALIPSRRPLNTPRFLSRVSRFLFTAGVASLEFSRADTFSWDVRAGRIFTRSRATRTGN